MHTAGISIHYKNRPNGAPSTLWLNGVGQKRRVRSDTSRGGIHANNQRSPTLNNVFFLLVRKRVIMNGLGSVFSFILLEWLEASFVASAAPAAPTHAATTAAATSIAHHVLHAHGHHGHHSLHRIWLVATSTTTTSTRDTRNSEPTTLRPKQRALFRHLTCVKESSHVICS